MPLSIEKNVPIPQDNKFAAAIPKYPFSEMAVGDSFLVPWESGKRKAPLWGSMVGRAKYRERLGCTFVLRALDEGIRIWRTA